MDTRKKTQSQKNNLTSQTQFQRRSSMELQSSMDQNTLYFEEIKRITTQLSIQMDNLNKDMNNFKVEVKKELHNDLKEIKQTMGKISAEISTIKEKINNLEDKHTDMQGELEEIKVRQDCYEDDQLIWETRARERCIKIRGLPEQDGEDLYLRLVPILAKFLHKEEQSCLLEIDRMFRLNSKIAKQKKIPRDIVIYFLRKEMKDRILKLHNEKPLEVDEKTLQIFKDVPAKVLKRRKEYKFLTTELRQNDINYRWLLPEGITFWYKKKKIQLRTIQQARFFWNQFTKEKKKTTQQRNKDPTNREQQVKQVEKDLQKPYQFESKEETNTLTHTISNLKILKDQQDCTDVKPGASAAAKDGEDQNQDMSFEDDESKSLTSDTSDRESVFNEEQIA
ncbi:uncharacterized protein LOC121915227 [Sceloporus undulatus]|uniref:uncharacterized protein LOC121915227 n=1 Tax=Sceloporus undulatus TaxID=8520 RepID=UPI001C4C9386|nr:uncharacterized protein LOC121915227 [Sceloporus undulatus]